MIEPKQFSAKTTSELLKDVQKKMVYTAQGMYNNLTLMLGNYINYSDMEDLCHYERILLKRQANANYAPGIPEGEIASRVIQLTK